MYRLLTVIIYSVCFLVSHSFAADASEIAINIKEKLSHDSQMYNFVLEVEKLFPDEMKEVVLKKINLEFKKLSREFKMPNCSSPSKTKNKTVYGLAQSFTSRNGRYTIFLHEDFIQTINDGGPGQEIDCGHKDERTLAKATLIHEIAHVADSILKISQDDKYKNFTANKSSFLQSPKFKIKDSKGSRSPDPYEFKNDKEHFAVNLEFALLDPGYACARPSTYRFISRLIKKKNDEKSKCNVFPVLANAGGIVLRKLDVDKLYQIHYLEASKGEKIESRFGHSMFRLIFCKDKTKMGDNCLDDISEHIVVSYAANQTTTNPISNALKGLLGGYTTNLFLHAFSDTLKTYNSIEERDLYSYPIQLTHSQKNDFFYKVIEEHWMYAGKYFFITNNCASESSRLLVSQEGIDINKANIPKRLGKNLEEQNLIRRDNRIIYREKGSAKKQAIRILNDYDKESVIKLSATDLTLEEMEAILSSQDSDVIVGSYLLFVSHLLDLKKMELEKYLSLEISRISKESGIEMKEIMPFKISNSSYGVPTFENIRLVKSPEFTKLESVLDKALRSKKEFLDFNYYTEIRNMILSHI